eukprot:scaffold10145_cov116-Isochrysis_galbana.AAC.6
MATPEGVSTIAHHTGAILPALIGWRARLHARKFCRSSAHDLPHEVVYGRAWDDAGPLAHRTTKGASDEQQAPRMESGEKLPRSHSLPLQRAPMMALFVHGLLS